MITLAALTAMLDDTATTNEQAPTIIISADADADADADAAVAAALMCFDADDNCPAVAVRTTERVLGMLPRRVAYMLPPPPQYLRRDIGSSGRALLPGQSRWEMVTLRCPQPGCTQRLGLVLYAPQPPRCPIHRDIAMVSDP